MTLIPRSVAPAVRAILMLGLLLTACQTSRPDFIAPQLPAKFSELFGSCSGDGASRITVYDGSEPIESLMLDWLVKDKQGWVAQSSSPFGSTIFELTYSRQPELLKAIGLDQLPYEFQASANGYLEVNGREIKVLLAEFPCFLRNLFPKAWLDSVVAAKVKEDRLQLHIWQEDRRLVLDLSKAASPRHCATIFWSELFGLVEHRMKICRHSGNFVFSGWQKARLQVQYLEGL